MNRLKEWYMEWGMGITLIGVIIFAVGTIIAYVLGTLGHVASVVSPIIFVGFVLIVIGVFSIPLAFSIDGGR